MKIFYKIFSSLMKIATIITISLLIFQSCAVPTLGPVESDQYMSKISKASELEISKIIFDSRVSWAAFNVDHCWVYPRFKSDCTSYQLNEGFTNDLLAGTELGDSILVLTESYITFLNWDDKQRIYYKKSSLSLSDVISLERHKYGSGSLMRIGMKNSEYKYYILTLMRASGRMQDSEKNDKLFLFLKNKAVELGAKIIDYH